MDEADIPLKSQCDRNRGACWAMPGVVLVLALFVMIFASQFTGADPVDAAHAKRGHAAEAAHRG